MSERGQMADEEEEEKPLQVFLEDVQPLSCTASVDLVRMESVEWENPVESKCISTNDPSNSVAAVANEKKSESLLSKLAGLIKRRDKAKRAEFKAIREMLNQYILTLQHEIRVHRRAVDRHREAQIRTSKRNSVYLTAIEQRGNKDTRKLAPLYQHLSLLVLHYEKVLEKAERLASEICRNKVKDSQAVLTCIQKQYKKRIPLTFEQTFLVPPTQLLLQDSNYAQLLERVKWIQTAMSRAVQHYNFVFVQQNSARIDMTATPQQRDTGEMIQNGNDLKERSRKTVAELRPSFIQLLNQLMLLNTLDPAEYFAKTKQNQDDRDIRAMLMRSRDFPVLYAFVSRHDVTSQLAKILSDEDTNCGRLLKKWQKNLRETCNSPFAKGVDLQDNQLDAVDRFSMSRPQLMSDSEIDAKKLPPAIAISAFINYFVGRVLEEYQVDFNEQGQIEADIENYTTPSAAFLRFATAAMHEALLADLEDITFLYDRQIVESKNIHWKHSKEAMENVEPSAVGIPPLFLTDPIEKKRPSDNEESLPAVLGCMFPMDTSFNINEGVLFRRTIDILSLLSLEVSPFGVMKTLMLAIRVLHEEAAEVTGRLHSVDADSIFPILVYTMVHADVPDVFSRLNIAQRFALQGSSVLGGEESYYLTCLEAAVLYICQYMDEETAKTKDRCDSYDFREIVSQCLICRENLSCFDDRYSEYCTSDRSGTSTSSTVKSVEVEALQSLSVWIQDDKLASTALKQSGNQSWLP